MIYRVTGDRAESRSVVRECAVRAMTRDPETALVPETQRSNCERLKNSAHSTQGGGTVMTAEGERPGGGSFRRRCGRGLSYVITKSQYWDMGEGEQAQGEGEGCG